MAVRREFAVAVRDAGHHLEQPVLRSLDDERPHLRHFTEQGNRSRPDLTQRHLAAPRGDDHLEHAVLGHGPPVEPERGAFDRAGPFEVRQQVLVGLFCDPVVELHRGRETLQVGQPGPCARHAVADLVDVPPPQHGDRLRYRRPVSEVPSSRRQYRGQKVYLRLVEPDDLVTIQRWFEDGEIASLMGGVAPTLAARRARHAGSLNSPGPPTAYEFLICRIEDDRPIGRTDLFAIDRPAGSSKFGITIGERDLWDAGYGADAVDALADFAFGVLRLDRLWLETASDNARAQRAYEKAGFSREGLLRHAYYQDGGYGDLVVMSLLRDEWAALDRPRSWDLVRSAGQG